MCQRDTILIVDDLEMNRAILSELFQDEYHLLEAENGEQALLLLKQYHKNIAITLLDVVMPVMDGYQVLKEIGGNGILEEVPVVVITADNSLEGELQAFDLGASDIIVKPFEPHVVKRRVHNIIELYLHKHNLENMVEEQARKLKESNDVLVDSLSSVIEYRSLETGQHIKRIRLLSKVLMEEVQKNCPEYGLNRQKIEVIASASVLHDIGKIAIEDRILNKPGRLTPEEFEIMKTHTVKGCQILDNLGRMSDQQYLQYAYNICRYHHERWDGRGYPEGLVGDAIPICAQVVSIVDAYDALTSDRVYKKAVPHQQAANMIMNGECGTYSPRLLECFKNVQPALAALSKAYSDGNTQPVDESYRENPRDNSGNLGLSALQLEQMKYMAMLRYENTTVVEVDFSTGSYHLVYASGGWIKQMFQGEELEQVAQKYLKDLVMPEDRTLVETMWKKEIPAFFEAGLLKQTWRHRLLDLSSSQWNWYDISVLRIDTEHPRQRKALLLWRLVGSQEEKSRKEAARESQEEQALYCLLKGVGRFSNDNWFTLLEPEDGFMGYSRKELEEKFQNRFIELIHFDDRQRVRKELTDQLSQSGQYELEYRITDASGRTAWMLDKGCLLTDQKGREYLYTLLVDIQQTKKAQEDLRLDLERYKIIMDQTNDILFEWDIETDHLTFSSNWKKRFGYDPVSEEASVRIPRISHLHPEDKEPFGHFMERFKQGLRYGEMEFRTSDSKGHYRWCKVRAALQADGRGRPCRAVGIVLDINEEKTAAQKLKDLSERDNLTRLYNKASARKKIEECLLKREEEKKQVLYIIDIDNFKGINDQYGHMFGDAVLTKIAYQLSRLFADGDVVARIGGDEFMAFVQEDLGEKQIESMWAYILDCFSQVEKDLPKDCHISGSIGISLCPEHGADFQTLFRKADLALYHAKECGKNQCQIYKPVMEAKIFMKPGAQASIANTAIDSDGSGDAALWELLPKAFDLLNTRNQSKDGVEKTLELIGRQMGVSRAYVFEICPDGSFENTFRWYGEGAVPLKGKVKAFSHDIIRAVYKKYFNDKGIFYCDDTAGMPEDIRRIALEQGIGSMLQCGIWDGQTLVGWIGFDDCNSRYMWTIRQIEAMTCVAELLSIYLLRMRAREETQRLQQLNMFRGNKESVAEYSDSRAIDFRENPQ